ncbi:MAG: hypothetical protein QJR03_12780 [Sphaerobacter sp.]|nr:hypothetical protein [Sphaerobacter sp.]MDI3341396.1 hypothetical protein [Sphaerobacter sp.]
MPEPPRPSAEQGLELALRRLGEQLDYPATPDLVAGVRQRLAAQPGATPRWRWRLSAPRRRAVAAGILAVLLLAAVVLIASPATRTAVADRLGLRGIAIITGAPTANPTATAATPSPPPTGAAALRLGTRTTLAEAQARVPFRILVPEAPGLGEPDEVYLDTRAAEPLLSLVWTPRAGLPEARTTGVGLLLTEFRGSVDEPLLKKSSGPDTRVTPVDVSGAPGYWLEGGSHTLMYRGPDGEVRTAEARLAGNTLIWERDGLTLRLESALTRDAALAIAEATR